jgi:hypothetical protein
MNEDTFGDARTYRGSSLAELLPQIREELGPDAVILREREGVIGGVGGFFGKRCVEVEAAPTWALLEDDLVAALPAHEATGLYGSAAVDEIPPPENPFVEALLDRAAALDELFVPESIEFEAVAAVEAIAIPEIDEPVPVRPAEPSPLRDEYDVRLSLAEAGLPAQAIEEVVRRAVAHLRPFAPDASVRDLVRRALRDAIPTPVGWPGRRVIALAGAPGIDTTRVAGALIGPFARAGARVAAVALGDGREGARLGARLDETAVELHVAHDVHDVERAVRRTAGADLVFAVAPECAAGDERAVLRAAGLLVALGPDEIHLVADGGASASDVLREHGLLDGLVPVGGLLPVGLEAAGRVGGVIGLVVAKRLDVRWIASAEIPLVVTTADPSSLAGACLA